MRNKITVTAYPDNRCQADVEKGVGKIEPLVLIDQEDPNPWSEKSVAFAPRLARQIAEYLLRAADAAETGRKIRRSFI